jgi:hypothetical protein
MVLGFYSLIEFMLLDVSLALYFGRSLLLLILKFPKAYILRLALRMPGRFVYG